MENNITGTPLDELVEFKYKVINMIEESPVVMGLLVGKQNVDLGDKLVVDAHNNQIFDYSFSTDTQLSQQSLIFVEAEMRQRRGIMKGITIYVQVVVHKDHMKLVGFKGVKGNRRDNLSRSIAALLEGSRDFGIGRLQVTQCYPNSAPAPYSSVMIVFDADELVNNGVKR